MTSNVDLTISPKRRTRRPKLDQRTRVRDKAARIFAERGFHAASMQDIADAMGFTKASIYYYYKSKDDLLFDILTFADKEALVRIDIEPGPGSDALAHVGRVVAAYVSWYLEHPYIAKVAFRDWSALRGEALRTQTERRRHYGHIMRDSIDRCRREGLIRPDADVGLIANFINGAVAAANVWFNPKGAHTADEVAQAFSEMALAILRSAPGKRSKVQVTE